MTRCLQEVNDALLATWCMPQEGKMYNSIHMYLYFRICNGRSPVHRVSAMLPVAQEVGSQIPGENFQLMFLCLILQTREESRCPLSCLQYTGENSIKGWKSLKNITQKRKLLRSS